MVRSTAQREPLTALKSKKGQMYIKNCLKQQRTKNIDAQKKSTSREQTLGSSYFDETSLSLERDFAVQQKIYTSLINFFPCPHFIQKNSDFLNFHQKSSFKISFVDLRLKILNDRPNSHQKYCHNPYFFQKHFGLNLIIM